MGLLAQSRKTAESLVQAILDASESPKNFLRRIGKIPTGIEVDIPEWDDMSDWQQVAFRELAEELGADFTRDEDNVHPNFYTTDLEINNLETDNFTVGYGRQEWSVYEDDDAAHNAAVRLALDAIDEGIFSTDYLSSYIEIDRLKSRLYPDVEDSERSAFEDTYSDNEMKRDFFLERGDLDDSDIYAETEDEDGDTVQTELDVDDGPLADKIEKLTDDYIESSVNDRLDDPISYLQEIFGEADGLKQAMDIAGIDKVQAAQDAVNSDGAAQYLATYDGNETNLPSGAVAFRRN
jgi:hypothetical protein